ncbi:undecaprenyl-diphosphatase [Lutibacter oricola]|uniref:Undecaprenyl-diphosphatase n=1 Tax=Lutibacter oricola TaxID=762486 RepID=A0A1H2RN78_9FLAO|nr:phosphatase PAP2 family protein [Lutibacter oricola]SDW20916.1 undecaprenyl-diphosphatase [Lutibacter oricola]
MELLDSIIEYDKQFLLFLHSHGTETWDSFWLFITNPIYWIPLFFIIFFLGNKVFSLKQALLITFSTGLSAGAALLIVNAIKNSIKRLRPINDESINDQLRILMSASDFSFVSGHSTVSFTIAFLSFWILKKHYKYAWLLFLFPLLFAYSRIYLAAHFPIDIFFGMILGFLIARIACFLIEKFILKSNL